MLWAACCIGFFGFLRAGEFTVPGDDAYDPTVHLSHEDIAVDNPVKPRVVRITIKQSKTDPFRKGVDLYLGRTFADLCPVISLLNYLLIANATKGPLFRFKDGRLLTRQQLVSAVKDYRKPELTSQNIMGTASGLELPQQQQQREWKTP